MFGSAYYSPSPPPRVFEFVISAHGEPIFPTDAYGRQIMYSIPQGTTLYTLDLGDTMVCPPDLQTKTCAGIAHRLPNAWNGLINFDIILTPDTSTGKDSFLSGLVYCNPVGKNVVVERINKKNNNVSLRYLIDVANQYIIDTFYKHVFTRSTYLINITLLACLGDLRVVELTGKGKVKSITTSHSYRPTATAAPAIVGVGAGAGAGASMPWHYPVGAHVSAPYPTPVPSSAKPPLLGKHRISIIPDYEDPMSGPIPETTTTAASAANDYITENRPDSPPRPSASSASKLPFYSYRNFAPVAVAAGAGAGAGAATPAPKAAGAGAGAGAAATPAPTIGVSGMNAAANFYRHGHGAAGASTGAGAGAGAGATSTKYKYDINFFGGMKKTKSQKSRHRSTRKKTSRKPVTRKHK